MGGGDLNLKKSWHPQTLRNIERVWKAEQKHEAEQKKIDELQKELAEERSREDIQRHAEQGGVITKKDTRLDWMYQGPGSLVNREEYLLGKPIDKYASDKLMEEPPGPTSTGLPTGSIFAATTTPLSANDMAAKIREDPLFLIRKKEEQKKREVLQNPVKMKKIKEMLKKNILKEKKKEKKNKKKKKHRRRHELSSDSDREARSRNHKKPSQEESHGEKSQYKRGDYGLQMKEHHRERHRETFMSSREARSCSVSPDRQFHHGRHKEAPPESHMAANPQRNAAAESVSKKCRTSTPPAPYQRRPPAHTSSKLSAEELEKRREEMMQNAKWRDEQRVANVNRYRQEDEHERQRERSDKRDGRFLHAMKLESAASSSVEDRVKRKVHSIQRTAAALDKNFMRR
ncbi:pre-mRNA-splicing factor CWC25 homolog isoform X1 [Lampetra fluviatilis]